MSDAVNHPNHYTGGGVECIDGIRAALGEGFADYCRGNVLKYVWRCGKKGDALEDLRKAAKYLQWAIGAMESEKKPETLAIPEGWRELEPNETPLASDMYEYAETWMKRFDDANCKYEWYSVRHIRKIETEKASEAPAEWIPKVGDNVRVLKPKMMATGHIGTISSFSEGTYSVRVESQKLTSFGLEAKDLELIEAAQ